MAWRYKKSTDPHHSDTYTFNRATLLDFAAALLTPRVRATIAAPAAQPADSAMEVLRELVELQGSEPAVDDLVDGTWLAWDAKRTAAWERARALTRQGDAG